MYQPWIFGAVMAAGTGLFAYTVKLQRPNVPPIEAEPPITAVRVLPPPTATEVAEPRATDDNVLQIPAIVIEGRRHHAATPAATATTPVEPVVERPCSTWREIGPTHVVAGTPSGNSSVRDLCQ